MPEPLPLVQVNAFTDKPFAGNPAAVCLPDGPRSDGWMQHVAAQMNLSETAFLTPERDGWRLRWFTPTVEVDLCGHATLASAHALWELGRIRPDAPAVFHTRSGRLTAERAGDRIRLDFPGFRVEPADTPAPLDEALGVEPVSISQYPLGYLIELTSEDAVRSLKPDWPKLERMSVPSLTVTARATTAGYDFVSRFFAPGFGIPEDPVTGSAHCGLGPYWSAKLGKAELLAYQASPRGGEVGVTVAGARVQLAGKAVTAWRGEWVAG
jgi:PhzF family phenazine biosynthesis protein